MLTGIKWDNLIYMIKLKMTGNEVLWEYYGKLFSIWSYT